MTTKTKRIPQKKLLKITDILNHCKNLNSLLSSNISQKDKATICITIESLLHSIDKYKGFNYLYWIEGGGAGAFEDYKQKLEGYGFSGAELERVRMLAESSKDRFLYGSAGAEARLNGNDEFVSYIQGEYSRTYYI